MHSVCDYMPQVAPNNGHLVASTGSLQIHITNYFGNQLKCTRPTVLHHHVTFSSYCIEWNAVNIYENFVYHLFCYRCDRQPQPHTNTKQSLFIILRMFPQYSYAIAFDFDARWWIWIEIHAWSKIIQWNHTHTHIVHHFVICWVRWVCCVPFHEISWEFAYTDF